MRLLPGCLLVAVPLVLLPSTPVRACECPSVYARAIWPREGATGVALDAPLVVGASELAPVQTQLLADDGTPVALAEQGRLELGEPSCANARYLFLAPVQPLEPSRSYIFSTTLPALGPTDRGDSSSVRFVTGTTLRDPTPPDLALHLFAAQDGAARRLEVFIEWQPSEPIFVGARGETASIAHAIFPGFAEQPAHIPFGVVSCADFTLIDVAGKTLSTPHLCEPSKCSTTQSLALSTCGGEAFAPLSWADWQEVPDGCGERAEGVAPEPSADPTPISDVAGSRAVEATTPGGGCALQPATRWRTSSPPLLLAAALAVLWRACQRRRSASGSAPRDSARH